VRAGIDHLVDGVYAHRETGGARHAQVDPFVHPPEEARLGVRRPVREELVVLREDQETRRRIPAAKRPLAVNPGRGLLGSEHAVAGFGDTEEEPDGEGAPRKPISRQTSCSPVMG